MPERVAHHCYNQGSDLYWNKRTPRYHAQKFSHQRNICVTVLSFSYSRHNSVRHSTPWQICVLCWKMAGMFWEVFVMSWLSGICPERDRQHSRQSLLPLLGASAWERPWDPTLLFSYMTLSFSCFITLCFSGVKGVIVAPTSWDHCEDTCMKVCERFMSESAT